MATSLKDDIFNLNNEHFERFINDVQVQLSISKLNNNELKVLSKILNSYSYDNYDISLMVVSIINNISNYSELINSINVENISEHDLKDLISVIQLPNNEYKITNMNELRIYDTLKKQVFVNNFNSYMMSSITALTSIKRFSYSIRHKCLRISSISIFMTKYIY